MVTKYKLYPYPVLSSSSNDYKTGSFSSQIELKKDGYDSLAELNSTLDCPSLAVLIKDGKAEYVYHLECAQTGYRRAVRTNKEKETFLIKSSEVNGILQICPFVVAAENITDYTSQDFHEDYHGLTFNIEAGCVMAAGSTFKFEILKNIDDLKDLPSIFGIARNADGNCRQMLVDMGEQRKIIIKLPLNAYYQYKQLNKAPQTQSLINSLIIIPALVYVLGELKSMSADDREANYSSCLWYKTVSSVLKSRFGINAENDDFSSACNPIELAQKMIGSPLPDAFQTLAGGYSEAGDDDG